LLLSLLLLLLHRIQLRRMQLLPMVLVLLHVLRVLLTVGQSRLLHRPSHRTRRSFGMTDTSETPLLLRL
jgi:hypothetical protein